MKHKNKYSLTQPFFAALAGIKCGKLNCVMKAYKIWAYTDSRNATFILALFEEKDECIYKLTKPAIIKLCLTL